METESNAAKPMVVVAGVLFALGLLIGYSIPRKPSVAQCLQLPMPGFPTKKQWKAAPKLDGKAMADTEKNWIVP